jgi:hypothetical protein
VKNTSVQAKPGRKNMSTNPRTALRMDKCSRNKINSEIFLTSAFSTSCAYEWMPLRMNIAHHDG